MGEDYNKDDFIDDDYGYDEYNDKPDEDEEDLGDDDYDLEDLNDNLDESFKDSDQNVYGEVDEEIKTLFSGEINPFTGKPIENFQDLKALNKMKKSAERQEMLDNAGLDEDTLNYILEESPYIKEVKSFLDEKRSKEASEAIEKEISKISEINPDIKSFEDLFMNDNFSKMNDLIMKGYAISDAYILCDYEALNKKAGEKERNSVISKIRQNKESSPGSLSSGYTSEGKSVDDMSDEEFEKMLAKAKRGELMRR